jgi:hypothetical protein
MVATRTLTGIAAVAAAAALTACAAQAGGTGPALRPARGTVTGRLVLEGGPLGSGGQQPAIRPISGLVQFTLRGGHVVLATKVGRSGSFTVTLVPGTYQVRGRSPAVVEVSSGSQAGKGRERPCTTPKTVTVTDQGSVSVTLTCIVP